MNGSDEDKPRSSGGLEDTVLASEPRLEIDGQPMRSARASIPPVKQERYRHGPEIGRGGMGRVVEAFDTQLGRTVALKEVLPKGASVERRFIREVEISTGIHPWANLVPGDAVIFGTSDVQPDGTIKHDGRVFAKVGTAAPREVVKLDGEIISTVGYGSLQFAALTDRGELVRGNLNTNAIERTNVDASPTSFVTSESGGRVIVATGDLLQLWDQHLVEVARFDKPIRSMARGVGGRILVTLLDNEVYVTAIGPNAKPHRLVSGGQHAPAVSADGGTLVATGNGLQITVVELASANRWTLPLMFPAVPMTAVSPSSRRIVQGTHGALMMWTLPTTSTDFGAWLDEQTNATKVGGEVLAWPWQVREP